MMPTCEMGNELLICARGQTVKPGLIEPDVEYFGMAQSKPKTSITFQLPRFTLPRF